MAGLIWQIDALRDLEEIAAYIALQSPDFAPIFVRRIVAAVRHLEAFPQTGRELPELGDPAVRELIFRNYRVVYRVESQVVILGVIHGAIDLGGIADRRGWLVN